MMMIIIILAIKSNLTYDEPTKIDVNYIVICIELELFLQFIE